MLKTEEEKYTINSRFKGLSMASIVSSLLYAALKQEMIYCG